MKRITLLLTFSFFIVCGSVFAGEPKPLGINTLGWEHSATISGDGHLLIFAYKHQDEIFASLGYDKTGPERPGNYGNNFDLYSSEKQDDGAWSEPVNLRRVNSIKSEYFPSLSRDGKTLFFVRERLKSKPAIYYSIRTAKGWRTPQELPKPFNTDFGETTPHQLYDGTAIIFASKRIGFYNPWNLWMSFKNTQGAYDLPKTVFKTTRNVWQPSIDPKTYDLYFVSDDTENNKFDIFVVPNIGLYQWDKPNPIKRDWQVDLVGSPFFDDSGQYMYFTCYKKGETGFMDIYAAKRLEDNSWEMPVPIEQIK